jgi:hypothetical protein
VAGQTATLDASASVDHDGSIATYDFDFTGDGANDVTGTTNPKQTFTYPSAVVVHPKVTVHDNEGQTDTAAIEVTVATPPQPTPTPTPTVTPTVTPTPTAGAAPKVKIFKTGKKGRARFTVTCDSRCKGTVTVTVQPATARKLGLGKKRTVARGSFSLAAKGTRTFSIRLSAKTRKGMTRKQVKRLNTRVTVRVKDAEGQSAKPSRAVKIRR